MSLKQLLAICSAPHAPRETGDRRQWAQVERDLGFALPQDYQEFIHAFGTGYFGPVDFSFLWVLNPFSHNYDLRRNSSRVLSGYEACQKSTPEYCPFQIGVGENGLFPCAITDNGDSLYWLTNGAPDQWTIVVYDGKVLDYEPYNLTLTGFLAAWLSGAITPEIFPGFDPATLVFNVCISLENSDAD